MIHKRRRSRRLSPGYSQRPSLEIIIPFDIHRPRVKVLSLKSVERTEEYDEGKDNRILPLSTIQYP